MKPKVYAKVFDIVNKTFIRVSKACIRRQKRSHAAQAVAEAYEASAS